MKKHAIILSVLLFSVSGSIHAGYKVRLQNNTSDNLQVQILTVGPSSADLTHTLSAYETKEFETPSDWCFSRIKINGRFPEGNWLPSAKCGGVCAKIIKNGEGRYDITGNKGSNSLFGPNFCAEWLPIE